MLRKQCGIKYEMNINVIIMETLKRKIEVTGKIHDLLEKLVKYPSGRDPRKDHVLAKGVYECAASCHAAPTSAST